MFLPELYGVDPSHSPFGLFAPGYKELGSQFATMVKEIEGEHIYVGFMSRDLPINQQTKKSTVSLDQGVSLAPSQLRTTKQ
jgi:hypothetical protein